MIEEQKILILRYLLEAKHKKVIQESNLLLKEDINGNILKTAVNELINDGYIKNTVTGLIIKQDGEDYLVRFDLNELPKNEILAVNIGHHIDGNVHGSDLSINDLNFSNHSQTNIHAKQSKVIGILKSILKWIVSNIWQIVIGLIIAYIAYLFGLNKPKP